MHVCNYLPAELFHLFCVKYAHLQVILKKLYSEK